MAHREAAARRMLPKTHVEAIDAEAVVVQACLARIQDHIAADARAARPPQGAAVRIVPAPSIALRRVNAAVESRLPGGAESVDISGRTFMGTGREASRTVGSDGLPEEEAGGNDDVDDKETLTERTDAIVAQSALVRLMTTVARIGATVTKAVETASAATARADALEARVAELEVLCREQEAKLAAKDDPSGAFLRYRELWAARHQEQQGILLADFETRRNAVAALMEKRAANAAVRRVVAERKRVFRERLAEASEAPDAAQVDAEIAAMMRGFAPMPSAADEAALAGAVTVPNFQLKSLGAFAAQGVAATRRLSGSDAAAGSQRHHHDANGTPHGSGGGGSGLPSPPPRAATPLFGSEAVTADDGTSGAGATTDCVTVPGAAVRHDEDLVLDNVDLLLDGENAGAFTARLANGGRSPLAADDDGSTTLGSPTGIGGKPASQQKPKKAAVRADELVITRFLGSSVRSVARMDPTATYIGVLLGALRFAPSEYTVLVLDPDALAGRRAALARQAASAGIASFWNEVAACTAPVVTIAQCNPPLLHQQQFVVERGGASDGSPSLATLHHEDGGSDNAISGGRQRVIPDKHIVVLSHEHGAGDRPSKGDQASTTADVAAQRAVVAAYRGDVRRPLPNALESGGKPEARDETRRQHPGIVSVLRRGAGGSSNNSTSAATPTHHDDATDLVAAGTVRCYASSMLSSCRVDALITPYYDLHSPFFSTADGPGQHVTIVFDNIAITPTAYSFACTHPTGGGAYPRSWVFEGSLDGLEWTLLRRHDQDESLSRYHPIGVWSLASSTAAPGTYYSSFRLRQTGPNAIGSRHLAVCSFEVYGRAMFVRERAAVDARFLPAVPRCHYLRETESDGASAGQRTTFLPSRRHLSFPRFDELPPEPAPAKGKGKGGKSKK